MGITNEQIKKLKAILEKDRIQQKDQSGMKVSYLEGYDVINTANECFTYAGYNYITIQDANEERQKRLSVLTQLTDDWNNY